MRRLKTQSSGVTTYKLIVIFLKSILTNTEGLRRQSKQIKANLQL